MSDRGFHRIEDELGEQLARAAGSRWGSREIEAYLDKHAAFFGFLDTAEQH